MPSIYCLLLTPKRAHLQVTYHRGPSLSCCVRLVLTGAWALLAAAAAAVVLARQSVRQSSRLRHVPVLPALTRSPPPSLSSSTLRPPSKARTTCSRSRSFWSPWSWWTKMKARWYFTHSRSQACRVTGASSSTGDHSPHLFVIVVIPYLWINESVVVSFVECLRHQWPCLQQDRWCMTEDSKISRWDWPNRPSFLPWRPVLSNPVRLPPITSKITTPKEKTSDRSVTF